MNKFLQIMHKKFNRLFYVSFLIIHSGILLAQPPNPNERKITVDSNHAFIKPAETKYLERGVGPQILDDDQEIITTTFDKNTPYSIEIYKDSEGNKSIQLSIRPQESVNPGQNEKSKIELNILRPDELNLQNGKTQSPIQNGTLSRLSFDLKFSEDYEIPKRWVLHFQALQCCAQESSDPSKRMQPPLTLQVDPEKTTASSIALLLMVRNDQHLGNTARHDNGVRVGFLDGSSQINLKRGEWHNLSLTMKPSPSSSAGVVIFSVNGERKAVYEGAWGYSDHFFSTIQGYALKLGIYRAAQPTLQKVEFRKINWEKLKN